ncbi:MAG: hypothetical protein M3M95_04045 [Pseudomonadota bacterium]|nr:hypothetical protein [Pseudomonadota bacterium]
MLFLLNDVVLNLEPAAAPPLDTRSLAALSLHAITRLGQDMYAEQPLMHRQDLARASRLALLIAAKTPEINAALFAAPAKGCTPEAVAVRYATLSIDAMAVLYTQQRRSGLTPVFVDNQVWRRLAA